MKFKHTIVINKPVKKVAELFAEPTHLKEYQEGFVKKELVSGIAGQDGAISKMYYKTKKYEMELTETITANRLPDSFEAFYHHKHMDNTLNSSFKALSDNQTEYVSEGEYVRVSWIMPKIMVFLFPGMFKKQVEKWLNNFKAFAEKQS